MDVVKYPNQFDVKQHTPTHRYTPAQLSYTADKYDAFCLDSYGKKPVNQSQHTPYQFKQADSDNWGLVKRFHKQTKLRTPQQNDRVFLVLKAESIIGVARFVKQHQAWWLRGLYIQPDYRQKHLATGLIKFALNSLAAPCYAFAQPGLTPFYQTLNFQPKQHTELPTELAELFELYQTSKPQLQIWYKA